MQGLGRAVILLGPPGAGKGTQAQRIAQRYRLPHLSTGDMFRDNISAEHRLGRKAKPLMERGDLVPDEIVWAWSRTASRSRIAQWVCFRWFSAHPGAGGRPGADSARSSISGSTIVLHMVVNPNC